MDIAGARLIDLDRHNDDRGGFAEIWRREWLLPADEILQVNVTHKRAGALVGLHYHLQQVDYWHVVCGVAHVVLHDLRVGSPTEGTTWTARLAEDTPKGLFIPNGVAHGFAALTDVTMIYLLDRTYDPNDELGVLWCDPEIGAGWQVTKPLVLSERDRGSPKRAELIVRPVWRPDAWPGSKSRRG